MFRVTQRVVINAAVLVEAASAEEADASAANWTEETIREAIKEESGGTDLVNDCEVETTSVTAENTEAATEVPIKVLAKQRTGGGLGKDYTFELLTDVKPTIEQVAKQQDALGFAPAGYGGPNHMVSRPTDDNVAWRTTWSCHHSCD